MGAVVVKNPESPDSNEMSCCENCAVRFSVLKRKKSCDECKRSYCAACAQKVPSQSSIRRCTRCSTLVNGNFNREDLSSFKAKELKQFLAKRDIPVNNCKEKSDFIELILQFSNNSQYRAEQAERQRHLQDLQERMRSNMSPPAPDIPNPPPYGVWYRIQQNTDTRSGHQNEEMESPTDTVSNSASPSTGPQTSDNLPQDSSPPSQVPQTEDTVPQTPPAPPRSKFTKLSDVETFEAISELSTRQLKEVLAGNFVDYKGCVEKNELRQRVERLWKENQQNLNVAEDIHEKGSVNLGDSELCKVCMDNVVDCVLLECGHMLTCTQCGKQLAECPICRQYVVRVVHVFKS